jgi:hypothetical protein
MYIGALAGYAKASWIDNIRVSGNPTLSVTLSRTNNYVGGAVGGAQASTLSRINAVITLNTQETEGSTTNHSVGGIVGSLQNGEVSESTMNGDLMVQFVNIGIKYVGGIGNGGTFKKNEAVLGTFKIGSKVEPGVQGSTIFVGGIAGDAATILDCTAQFKTLDLAVEDPTVGMLYAGGLGGNVTTMIANSHARFETITVKDKSTGGSGTVQVGGLAGYAIGGITSSYLEGGSIAVTGEGTDAPMFYVGGLAGRGNVSRSRIGYGMNISLETKSVAAVNVGGLIGEGSAEYSFIGTKDSHAAVDVKINNSRSLGCNTYVGGINGQGYIWGTSFQYNYAFCNVSLKTEGTAGLTAVGGLAGSLNGYEVSCTQSYAAGTVSFTNNYTETAGYYAGGIVGYAEVDISQCAALNEEVSINGTNTVGPKNWRRIAYPTDSAWSSATFNNNITTVTKTPPNDYTPVNGSETGDGILKNSIGETDFGVNGLNWDFENIWKWDNGYPVLKDEA